MIRVKDIKWRQFFCGLIITVLFTISYDTLHIFGENLITASLLCILCFSVIPLYTHITQRLDKSSSFDLAIILVGIGNAAITVFIMFNWKELPLSKYKWYGDCLKAYLFHSPSFLTWLTAIAYTKLLKCIKSKENSFARNAGIIYSVIIFIPVLFMVLESITKIDDLGMWATLTVMAISVIFYLRLMFKEGNDRAFSLTVIAFIITFTVPAATHLASFTAGWGCLYYIIYMPIIVLGLIALDTVLWIIKKIKTPNEMT